MTRKELEKFIDEEVSKLTNETLREPAKELPKAPPVAPIIPSKPVLKDETEIDEYLFKAGMKEK
jgi:hypothetical protein